MTAPRPKYEARNLIVFGWSVLRDETILAKHLPESEARRWAASEELRDAAMSCMIQLRALVGATESILAPGLTKILTETADLAEAAIRRAETPGGENGIRK